MNIRKFSVAMGVWVCLAGVPVICIAQEKTQSLADAAHKAKGQEKQPSKANVVWTNDNLPASATVSVVGQVPPSTAQQNASVVDPPGNTGSTSISQDRAKLAADLAAAKKDLASAKTDLDLAQREYKLDSDQFYSAPNYAANQQGQAKLDADRSQVSAKQQAVDSAQKKVNELRKQLDELNDKSKLEAPASKS